MRLLWIGRGIAAGLVLLQAANAGSGASSDPVLATVNGEPVTLSRVLGAGGASPAAGEAAAALDRMIGVELVVQEGYRMGLEETIEVRDQMGIFERDTLRDGLFGEWIGDLRPDEGAIASMTKAMTAEVLVRSVAFEARAGAEELLARVAQGEDFDAVAKDLAGEGRGIVDPGDKLIRMSELLPGVQAAIAHLEPGGVSTVYELGDRFAVSRLVERRPAPDPDARSKAEQAVLRRMQAEAIASNVEALKRKHAKVDQTLMASLDFQAEEPGFESYLEDGRALVAIEGAEPITVGDLADAVRKRLFHGPGRAADRDRLNRKRDDVLEDLIAKRVVMKEAVARGLDKRPEYLALRDERERELIFGAFVAKAIEPEVKVSDAEVARYYEAHRQELTGPDMARLDSIAFRSRAEAEAALAKLRAGADMAWMRTNAPGRIDPKDTPDLLVFPATPVMVSEVPADLRQALAGADSGELRLYGVTNGPSYVILVKEMLPGQTLPLEKAMRGIRARLTGEKRQKAFDDYVATLRKASEVEVLVTPEQLERLAAPPAS